MKVCSVKFALTQYHIPQIFKTKLHTKPVLSLAARIGVSTMKRVEPIYTLPTSNSHVTVFHRAILNLSEAAGDLL